MILKINSASGKMSFFRAKVSLVALVIIFCTTFTAFATSNLITTTVIFDDEETTVVSFAQDADEIIEKSGFDVSPDDFVNLDSFDITADDSVIEIDKAYSVTIEQDGEVVAQLMVAGNVAYALELAEITLASGDVVSPSKSTIIEDETIISISKAFGVTLVCEEHSYSFDVASCTVEQLLEMAEITLGEDDIISHELNEVLQEDEVVTINRVVYVEYEETSKTTFDTVYEETDELYEGQSSIKQTGVKGEVVFIYCETYIDGELVDTEFVSSEVTLDSVEEIVLIGTKVVETTVATTEAAVEAAATTAAATTTTVPTTSNYVSSSSSVISELTQPSSLVLDSNGIPTEYVDVITGPATAYCSGTTTSTGQSVIPGRVAVDPSEIPYGSELYIVSTDGNYIYGYSVASDTGGFVTNSNTVVDLYMNTYSECVTFGRRNVTIYVLSYN